MGPVGRMTITLEFWEDVAHRVSVNERPLLNKIRQRIAQLRAQLTSPVRSTPLCFALARPIFLVFLPHPHSS